MKRDAIAIKIEDNVATAMRDLAAGQEVIVGLGEQVSKVRLSQAIDYGHKLAIKDIARGAEVLKYAAVIGKATHDIAVGQHVHVHNVESLRGRGDLQQQPCGCNPGRKKGIQS